MTVNKLIIVHRKQRHHLQEPHGMPFPYAVLTQVTRQIVCLVHSPASQVPLVLRLASFRDFSILPFTNPLISASQGIPED